MEKLLTVKEASEYLNISEDRAYTLCRQNVIPHCRLNRTIRISSIALSEFVANGGRAFPGFSKREL